MFTIPIYGSTKSFIRTYFVRKHMKQHHHTNLLFRTIFSNEYHYTYGCRKRYVSNKYTMNFGYMNIPIFNNHYYYYRNHYAGNDPISYYVDRQERWDESHEKQKMKKEGIRKPKRLHLEHQNPINTFPTHMIKIEFIHSIYELQVHDETYNNKNDAIPKKEKYKNYSYNPKSNVDEINDIDKPGVFRKIFDYDEILLLANDYYGMNCDTKLEYYNYRTQQWHLVQPSHFIDNKNNNNNSDIQELYKGRGDKVLPLRIRSEYDDGTKDTIDDDDFITISSGRTNDRIEATITQSIIRQYVSLIQQEQYIRASETTISRRRIHTDINNNDNNNRYKNTNSNDNTITDNTKYFRDTNDTTETSTKTTTITTTTASNDDDVDIDDDTEYDIEVMETKHWFIQRANHDTILASYLLSHPGALHHLVQCIHWDKVWDKGYHNNSNNNNNNNVEE